MNIHSHLRVPMYIQQTCTLSRAAKHSQTLHALALAVAALHYSASPSLIPLLRCCSLSALALCSRTLWLSTVHLAAAFSSLTVGTCSRKQLHCLLHLPAYCSRPVSENSGTSSKPTYTLHFIACTCH